MKALWKVLLIMLCCAFLLNGKASAAWVVGAGAPYPAPYWSSYGNYPYYHPYYAAAAPVYAPPVYAGVPVHYYAPAAPVYAARPVYYAPSGVYVRPRAYAVYQPYYYPGPYMVY
jgi:hypothetical protein